MGMKIQAVFFDMGGTIETFEYTREMRLEAVPVLRAFLNQHGISLPLSDEQLLDVIADGLKRYKQWCIASMDELSSARIWSEYVFPGVNLDFETLHSIAEPLTVLMENVFYKRELRPEVPAVLQAIQKMGLKMGVISNVSSQGLVPENLKKYGIFDHFSPIVLSSVYGRRKPDPAIFHYAARLADVPTSACLYVGDRVKRDIEGARRAGFGKAVQIVHPFEHGEDDNGMRPDAVITNMAELLDILRAESEHNFALPVGGEVRGVIFDAGDLLYYREEKGTKFATFLMELGMQVSPNHSEMKKAIEHKAYRGQVSHDEYRESIVRLYGVTDPEHVERGKKALIDDDANVTFFDGVPETLLKLKDQGYLLGIVTDTANSISAKLSWFERGGFGHVWDSIISSMDLGVRKPDPMIYQAALRQLGLEPSQTVFVGHRSYELEGARGIGMPTIAFNYDQDAVADLYIRTFSELPDVLELVGDHREHRSSSI